LTKELPNGWVWTTIDRVAAVQGGIQKQQKRRPVHNRYPFLRVANVGRGTLDLGEVHEVELFDGEIERFALSVGDLLVVEGNGSADQLGRAAMWHGQIQDCVHQNHLIRIRPSAILDPSFLQYLWNSSVVSTQLKKLASSTSGLHTLSTAKIKRVEIPLPPLAEQHRIVEILEDHLSRLDAGSQAIIASSRRLIRLRTRLMSAITSQPHSSMTSTTIGAIAQQVRNGISISRREFPLDRICRLTHF
jgi:type I restriction enzyme S subunit